MIINIGTMIGNRYEVVEKVRDRRDGRCVPCDGPPTEPLCGGKNIKE